LREPTYFILLSLNAGPIHGYAIMKDVAYLSEERVVLSTSTLYSALKRLLDQGWIRREDDPSPGAGGRERKVYRLTPLGQQVLQADIARLESLLTAARRRAVKETA
jgi:DNA-binding PadR family transcriptional regulator